MILARCWWWIYADLGTMPTSSAVGAGMSLVGGLLASLVRRTVGIVSFRIDASVVGAVCSGERRQVMTGRRRKPGRMGPFIEGYRDWLTGRGYTSGTVINMLAMAGGLGRWMDAYDLAPADLDREAIAEFRDAMRAMRRRCLPGARGLDPLLDYLTHVGVLVASPAPATPVETLVERYRMWLVADTCARACRRSRQYRSAAGWRAGRNWPPCRPTLVMIAPTVRQAMRINSVIAVLEVWVASQATWASK